jgi:recombination protein RecR
LENLIRALKRLPGVGEKTATRYAFYTLNAPEDEIKGLISALRDVREKLRLCEECLNLTETSPCAICASATRDASRICVVETPMDVVAMEKGGVFRGLYHVLHGLLSPLDAVGPEDIRVSELLKRLKKGVATEVILALNPTLEGETTASYLCDALKGAKVTISRIAYGIPVGGALEHADPLTLARALENRVNMQGEDARTRAREGAP